MRKNQEQQQRLREDKAQNGHFDRCFFFFVNIWPRHGLSASQGVDFQPWILGASLGWYAAPNDSYVGYHGVRNRMLLGQAKTLRPV